MQLGCYFENVEGTGILATCDPSGELNQAIYSKPFVMDDETVAFVMCRRLSHQNLQGHMKASYLFLEKGDRYKGLRLSLTMQREEKNRSLIETLRKKQPCICSESDDSEKYLVFFDVNRVRPLFGGFAQEAEVSSNCM
ncbi:MAG: pyridoxamine 5'-phosphate oxidase family protein [Planctomycetota bacterium]|jgi:hypothetical protein